MQVVRLWASLICFIINVLLVVKIGRQPQASLVLQLDLRHAHNTLSLCTQTICATRKIAS